MIDEMPLKPGWNGEPGAPKDQPPENVVRDDDGHPNGPMVPTARSGKLRLSRDGGATSRSALVFGPRRMEVMANGNSHDWAFAATSRGEIVQAVAICSRCGLIRTEADQSATGGERRLILRAIVQSGSPAAPGPAGPNVMQANDSRGWADAESETSLARRLAAEAFGTMALVFVAVAADAAAAATGGEVQPAFGQSRQP